MGIITKIKDVLGIADGGSQPRRTDTTDATASPGADAATERAVKGVETGTADESTTETTDAATETAGAVPETADAATETTDVDADEAIIQDAEPDEEPTADDGEPVDTIKGIGASYAERLGAAGVHTVPDLAAADAEDLADETGIGAGRIGNWIERAKVRSR